MAGRAGQDGQRLQELQVRLEELEPRTLFDANLGELTGRVIAKGDIGEFNTFDYTFVLNHASFVDGNTFQDSCHRFT